MQQFEEALKLDQNLLGLREYGHYGNQKEKMDLAENYLREAIRSIPKTQWLSKPSNNPGQER